jgi:glycerophosphoryl diester phosphodiesterase
MAASFDLQGHRGARGLKPENTLPSFEIALDLMVTSLETDLHLTRDGVPVLFHDEALSPQVVRVIPAADVPSPAALPRISSLTLAQLRNYVADLNPDPVAFPRQNTEPTPVARAFCQERGLPAFTIPTLEDLIAFVNAYTGRFGRQARKTDLQRRHARGVKLHLELKRVPFRPQYVGDGFDGGAASDLEKKVVEIVRKAEAVPRTVIQAFDHRALRAIRLLEPDLTTAVLTANTAPVSVVQLVRDAYAHIYSPDFQFLDHRQIQQAHDANIPVVPYTVNDPTDMTRLLSWNIDGLITDYPDRVIPLLKARHLRFP